MAGSSRITEVRNSASRQYSTAESFVTLFSWDGTPGINTLVPSMNTSTLNPQPGLLVSNAARVHIGDTWESGAIGVYNDTGQTDILIDVVGYCENHNHDDRYTPSS